MGKDCPKNNIQICIGKSSICRIKSTKQRTKEMETVFEGKGYKNLDYISSWFKRI